MHHAWSKEDNLKMKMTLKNKDDLKNEDALKIEDKLGLSCVKLRPAKANCPLALRELAYLFTN